MRVRLRSKVTNKAMCLWVQNVQASVYGFIYVLALSSCFSCLLPQSFFSQLSVFPPLWHPTTCKISCCLLSRPRTDDSTVRSGSGEKTCITRLLNPPLSPPHTDLHPPIPDRMHSLPVNRSWSLASPVIFLPINPVHSPTPMCLWVCVWRKDDTRRGQAQFCSQQFESKDNTAPPDVKSLDCHQPLCHEVGSD